VDLIQQKETVADRPMSLFRFLSSKVGTGPGPVAGAHTVSTSSHGPISDHGHGHDSHAAPWQGVNLWRTPYKGDTDTVTQVKRTKGALDKYVENRIRRIQELQLVALVNINIIIVHFIFLFISSVIKRYQLGLCCHEINLFWQLKVSSLFMFFIKYRQLFTII
jgi:hypothetical protein